MCNGRVWIKIDGIRRVMISSDIIIVMLRSIRCYTTHKEPTSHFFGNCDVFSHAYFACIELLKLQKFKGLEK